MVRLFRFCRTTDSIRTLLLFCVCCSWTLGWSFNNAFHSSQFRFSTFHNMVGGGRSENAVRPAQNLMHRGKVSESDPMKLLEFVCSVFPSVKRTTAKQWLKYNMILVNEEAQSKHDFDLRIGDWIAVKANSKSSSGSMSGTGSSSRGIVGTRRRTVSNLVLIYSPVRLLY